MKEIKKIMMGDKKVKSNLSVQFNLCQNIFRFLFMQEFDCHNSFINYDQRTVLHIDIGGVIQNWDKVFINQV